MRTFFGLTVFILFFFLSLQCLGQGGYVTPKVSGKYVKELQNAVLAAQSGNVSAATETIRSIIRQNPDWTEPRQELSRIYFDSGKKQLAIAELEASLAIDTLSQLQQLYTLGRIYEENNNPDKAMACYRAVIQKGIHQQGLVQRAMASFQVLEGKIELWRETYTIELNPLAPEINTPHHEYLGRWTLDGQKMIFTRRLYEQEDIFIAIRDSADSSWKIEDFTFNTEQNEAAHAISPDGKYLVFTSCNRQDGMGGCDLYLSVLKDGFWSLPVNMGSAFNSPSWDSQPCFGLDGMSLFFSSNRPGGRGGSDIWYMYQIALGKWSAPINMGPMINTADNEESPFIHFDGQTLYFMRDGKEGLGGFDLYISRKNIDGSWCKPENMGAPINSGAHEGALSLHPDGKRALITRATEDQRNDLFEFVLPEKFRAAPLQALHVMVRDELTQKPVRARLEVFEIDRNDTIRLSQWADEEGKISVALQRSKSYGLLAEADKYIMYSSHLEADTASIRYLDIRMTPLVEAGDKVIVLQNIFFETGSAELLSTSGPELNKLLSTLRAHADMKIEIRGHTDNVGSDQDNQRLSEDRAMAVYHYLLQRGIEATRLSYIGFGESQPVADNATAAGRKKNRRTEFRIISN